jgi:hypothetical protein
MLCDKPPFRDVLESPPAYNDMCVLDTYSQINLVARKIVVVFRLRYQNE